MSALVFNTPPSIAAARHIVESPPLSYSPFLSSTGMRAINGPPVYAFRYDPASPFSTGEAECLLPLLESLSTTGPFFDLKSLWKLDEVTRMTACQAIMLYAGVISEVMTP
jgi:hypothetical protein